MSEQSTNGPSDGDIHYLDDERWLDWPHCPECGRSRPTYCPTCDIAGDQFPLAEYIPAAAPVRRTRRDSGCACQACDGGSDENHGPILLMCPSCDEAFAPKFYRLCEECGHDFGEGRQVKVYEPIEWSGRVVFVMAALGALTIAALVYWWLLLRA